MGRRKGSVPPNLKDETGKKYGFLRVLCKSTSPYPNNGNITKEKRAYWWCFCTRCNQKIVRVSGKHLREGHTISCGCLLDDTRYENGKKNAIDLTGLRFGKLVAKEQTDLKFPSSKCVVWRCECDCGNKKCYVLSTNLLRGVRTSCGCEFSKGETKVQKVLEGLNIRFIKNKTFDDCRNPKTHRLLKFDFFLPEYNTCIEYDGEQHFKEIEIFKDSLRDIRYRDAIKDEYCSKNNVYMIRIPYWDLKNIDELFILDRLPSKNES